MPDLSRRVFLGRLGRASFAVAVLGIAACGDDDASPGDDGAASPATSSPPAADPPATQVPTTTLEQPAEPTTATTEAVAAGVEWQRVSLGFVSAYVLVRGGEAAVVDTGVSGSADDIEAGLGGLGLGWDDVGHVILTHLHGDHIGSVEDVMDRAADAAGYAGEADIPSIPAPRPLVPVGDGDRVFDLDIIATPGHTPGHISVHDPVGGILVAGDALIGEGGGVVGPSAQFSDDMPTALESARKLGALEFEIALFGHGDPVLTGASGLVAALFSD